MERKKNILCTLMLMFAASASFTCANAHEIELREINPNDTIWTEEDVHPKRKSPGIRIPLPTVEYIPEQGVILFESSTDQSISYCIAEGDDMDNPIASGEMFDDNTRPEDYFNNEENAGKAKIACFQKNGRDHYAKITEVNIEKGYVRYSDSDTKRGTINIDKLDGIMFYEKNK